MRKITLLTSVLLTAPFAAGNVSAQCVVTQDCASLGYTETSCENGGIKCPFGNTWACKESSDTGSESPENGRDNPDCTYGAIYYSDGTCVKEFLSEKTAIGIVVYDNDITHEKWIMALDNASTYTIFSKEYFDIPEITNYRTEQTAIYDLNSCGNTKSMFALGESKYPAAAKTRNYAPAGAENTRGKWCLPSVGIWNVVNNHRTEIDEAISRASGTALSNDRYYWSSSENSAYNAWSWDSSGAFTYGSKYNDYDVRPVMEI